MVEYTGICDMREARKGNSVILTLKRLSVFWLAVCLCLVCAFSSCGDDLCEVGYELSDDKMSAVFTAVASASKYSVWTFYIEGDGVVGGETLSVESTITRSVSKRRITAIAPGEVYVAFYIHSASAEYTRVFGFNVSVDSRLQLTVSEYVSEADEVI